MLNSKVSNGAWAAKREALKEHDVLKLNMDLVGLDDAAWNEQSVRERTEKLINAVVEIWPVPAGHKSDFGSQPDRPSRKIEVADLS